MNEESKNPNALYSVENCCERRNAHSMNFLRTLDTFVKASTRFFAHSSAIWLILSMSARLTRWRLRVMRDKSKRFQFEFLMYDVSQQIANQYMKVVMPWSTWNLRSSNKRTFSLARRVAPAAKVARSIRMALYPACLDSVRSFRQLTAKLVISQRKRPNFPCSFLLFV